MIHTSDGTQYANLDDLMQFDRVIEIREDGSIIDRHDISAPRLFDEALPAGWEFVTGGYSAQDQYKGPIMHESESIAGQLARDIFTAPGIYVSLIAHYSDVDEDNAEDEVSTGGWAIARML